MNNKIHTTFSINAEVWNNFQLKYPRKASEMIEGFMRSILTDNNPEFAKESVEQKIKAAEEEKSIAVAKLARLKSEQAYLQKVADQQKYEENAQKIKFAIKLFDDLGDDL